MLHFSLAKVNAKHLTSFVTSTHNKNEINNKLVAFKKHSVPRVETRILEY